MYVLSGVAVGSGVSFLRQTAPSGASASDERFAGNGGDRRRVTGTVTGGHRDPFLRAVRTGFVTGTGYSGLAPVAAASPATLVARGVVAISSGVPKE